MIDSEHEEWLRDRNAQKRPSEHGFSPLRTGSDGSYLTDAPTEEDDEKDDDGNEASEAQIA